MNKQNRTRLALSAFLLTVLIAASFPACDMSPINDLKEQDDSLTGSGRNRPGSDGPNSGGSGREISEREKDVLEQYGHFLKFSHMPSNTQIPNVFSVKIANSAAEIGKLHKNNPVCVFRDKGECTVYVPLSYMDESEFLETGFFFVAFSIHVDALTKYIVDLSDKLLVHFTDGRGEVDVRSLPEKFAPVVDPRYLTIFNLPPNLSARNISNVLVFNQKENAAECADYSLMEISISDGRAAVRIPLSYYNMKESVFIETGSYFVSFDINIDADTRFFITKDARIQVPFVNGNGSLDINNLPQKQVPYLTIFGLPFYTDKKQITDVGVYNLVGQVATCIDSNNISISRNNEYATANIPLSSSVGEGYFNDTGRFAISFTVNVDIETQISFQQIDNVTLQFTAGSAVLDVISMYGYFAADLTNSAPSDSAAPILKHGSSFDINGYRHTISSDTPVIANPPMESCFLYLYAFRDGSNVYYEYSKTAPTYSTAKKGWYNGNSNKRALWKMIYLHESYQSTQFLLKTYIADDFPHRETIVISKSAFNSFTSSISPYYLLSGAENPPTTTVTLQPGVYIINLDGAGGGRGGFGSYGNANFGVAANGGAGGNITEILTLRTAITFYAYTGSGGGQGIRSSTAGNLSLVVDYPMIYYPSGTTRPADYDNLIFYTQPGGGGGGGGGGSGTFLYSEKDLYFLCAGGGGGASGVSFLTPGGAGGAGGAIGPGGGGGASGYLRQYFTTRNNVLLNTMESYSGSGGNGGGYSSPPGGSPGNGSSGDAILFFNVTIPSAIGSNGLTQGDFYYNNLIASWLYPGPSQGTKVALDKMNYSSTSSGRGGTAAAVTYFPGPLAWRNTNNNNGQGASSLPAPKPTFYGSIDDDLDAHVVFIFACQNGIDGSPGGNNRTDAKGGGAPGGSSDNNLPDDGSPGSITIYKIH